MTFFLIACTVTVHGNNDTEYNVHDYGYLCCDDHYNDHDVFNKFGDHYYNDYCNYK